jgi:hypothetical protein
VANEERVLDFSKIKADFRKEIVREGTVFFDGQLKIATSADSRASGLGLPSESADSIKAKLKRGTFAANRRS